MTAPRRQNNVRRRLAAIFACLFATGLFLLVSGGFQWAGLSVAPAHAGFFNDDLDTFEEVITLIDEKYVYPPDYKGIFSAAIDGMVKSIDSEKIKLNTDGAITTLSGNESRISYQLDYSRDHNTTAFKKIYRFLLAEYKDRVNKKDLEEAAIGGAITALDAYSQYLEKESFERAVKDTEGKYGGLGMVITMKDSNLVVVKTMRNSPAERARIMPNDVFVKVENQEIKNMQVQELADKLRGYPNTKVTITLLRPSDKKERTITMTREIISVETVAYKLIMNQTGYIKLSGFSRQTEDQLNEALDKGRADKIKSIILDLRDNPGGLLEQSVKIASHFLTQDRLIVYTQGRQKNDRYEYLSKYNMSLSNMPLVILINHYSASASEIVAGSLQDLDQALLVGENSYGKGSVQTIFRLNDGSGLRLTTSKYYTPSGVDITAYGISPDIEVDRDSPENSKIAQEAETRKKRPASPRPSQIQMKESDLQRFLKERGVAMKDTADAESDPLVLYSALLLKDNPSKKKTMEKARELAANIHY